MKEMSHGQPQRAELMLAETVIQVSIDQLPFFPRTSLEAHLESGTYLHFFTSIQLGQLLTFFSR
jgi:hypothetical protein